MAVEVSEDGKAFAPAGPASWEDCFFPPGDEMLWEGADSPVYEHLPAGGIIGHNFPVIFEKALKTRYVRFRLSPPAGTEGKAGIGLWELEVYDRIEKLPWSERIVLPGATQPH
jgi:hypothetical protein